MHQWNGLKAMFELVKPAFAHEAYVLPQKVFQSGLTASTTNPLGTLAVFFSPEYLTVTLIVGLVFTVLYFSNFLLAISQFGKMASEWLKKYRDFGLFIVRLTIAASFLYGAQTQNIFGPELGLSQIAFGQYILPLKVILGLMLLTGTLTEVAAIISIIIFVVVFASVGGYVLTYLNYLGELIALALFGSRFLSIDALIFKQRKFHQLETPMIRLGLGLALIYTAWNIKFIHQSLPITVVNSYHLQTYFFNWNANYIAVGAGIVELMIGLFILFGFAQRLTSLIFMAFITLSLLYFREAVWPHLLLYGISVLIFIDSADFLTLDHYLVPWLAGKLKIRHTVKG